MTYLTYEKFVNCADAYLTAHEQVLELAYQNGMALFHAKDAVMTTENRLLFLRRHWFGAITCKDVQWLDVIDVHIKQHVFSSSLICRLENQSRIAMHYLHRERAARLYRMCQQREQDWRERRRIRSMEEDYARSGGVRLDMPTTGLNPPQTPAAAADSPGPRIQLEELQRLFEDSHLNEAEYQAKRTEIINRL